MDTKKLRQKILDLAIHGRLVPQDPNDEPASVLLQRIREEKERLIKEGKIKQPKNAKKSSDTTTYGNDVPFEVPDSWEWCRLEEIVKSVTDGDHQAPPKSSNGVPFLVISDVADGKIHFENTRYVPQEYYDKISTDRKAQKGDILFTVTGSYGIVVNVETEKPFCFQRHIGLIKPIGFSGYLSKVLSSEHIKKECDDLATGTAQKTVGLETLRSFLIPVPPLPEQHRIVAEVERWFALIDKIEQGKADLQAAVKQTKSKILDLAIHGKLVPQCADDEPATELLRRINPSAQPCDKGTYKDLPYGWIICPMGYLANIIGGVSYKKEDITTTGIRILRGGNIQEGQIETYDDDVYISSQYHSQENAVQANDIVLVASTGSSILIGKTGFANKSLPNTQIGAFLRIIRMKTPLIAKYVNCVFLSDYYKNYIRGIAKGSNINNIKNNYITDFQIALPPLAEQHRIVSKIEELFAQLDSIQSSLEA